MREADGPAAQCVLHWLTPAASAASPQLRPQQPPQQRRLSNVPHTVPAGSKQRPAGETQPDEGLVAAAYRVLCQREGVRPNRTVLQQVAAGVDLREGARTAVSSMDLCTAQLGVGGLRPVVALLRYSPRLRELRLVQQCIDAAALTPLTAACLSHRGLRRLDLSRNPLSITAARQLAELARQTETLEEVCLEGTEVAEEWRQRIQSRMRENTELRREGLMQFPVWRPPGAHRVVPLLVAAPSFSGFAAELRILEREVLPAVSRTLHTRGVMLVPLRLQWEGPGEAATSGELWRAALEWCRDGCNHGLPWALFLCAAKGTLKGDGTQGADAGVADATAADPEAQTAYGAAASSCLAALSALPPLPPLVDRNGHRRGPLREQVRSVLVLSRTPPRGGGGPAGVVGGPLRSSRLCASHSYSEDDVGPVFGALAASHLLLSLDTVYPTGSNYGTPVQVAAGAAECYPPLALSVEEVHGLGPGVPTDRYPAPWEDAESRVHWRQADMVLDGYITRQQEERELMVFCDRYMPESGEAFPLIVYGQDGVGKSALLARVASTLRRAYPPCEEDAAAIIVYFVAAESAELADCIRHLRRSLRGALGLPRDASLDVAPISVQRRDWYALLGTPSKRKICIFIAGLDRIVGGSGAVLIPPSVPKHLRLIASCATESALLQDFRQCKPQPYELLVPQLGRRDVMTLLRAWLRSDLPGLSTEAAGRHDEGVLSEPLNAADAVCFKDNAGLPLFIRLAVELLVGATAADEAAALAVARALPEDVGAAFNALLDRWGAELGHELVRHTAAMFSLYADQGLALSELAAALEPSPGRLRWERPAEASGLHALLVRMRCVLSQRYDGSMCLRHPLLAAAVRRRWNLGRTDGSTEQYHSALAMVHFGALAAGAHASPCERQRALAVLPECLVAADRVLDAHALLSDVCFAERKLQGGLFLRLLRDIEMVQAAIRRCVEAFVPGFEHHQRRAVQAVTTLRRIRQGLTAGHRVLGRHPSVVQYGINLPSCHELHKAAADFLDSDAGRDYPVLRWRNKLTRGCLADAALQLPQQQLRHVSFAPVESSLLVATAPRAVYVIRRSGKTLELARTLAITDELPDDGYLASHFTQDATQVVTVLAEMIIVFDWEADAPVRHVVRGAAASICRCLNFDTASICAVLVQSGKGCIIDRRKGKVISTLTPHSHDKDGPEPIRDLFFAAKANVVVSVGAGAVCVYRGKEQLRYCGHSGLITCCAINPDGEIAASVDTTAVVEIWDAVSGAALHALSAHAPTAVSDLSFHPSGHMLVSSDEAGKVRIWLLQSGEEVKTDGVDSGVGPVQWAGIMPNGSRLVARCGGTLRLWETALFESQGVMWGHLDEVTHVALAAEEALAASAGTDGQVLLWDVDRADYPPPAAWMDPQTIIAPTPGALCESADVHTKSCLGVCVRDDGRFFAACFADGALRFWNRDGAPVAGTDGGACVAACFAGEGDTAYIAHPSRISVYDFKGQRQISTVPVYHGLVAEQDAQGLRPFVVSPTGRLAACVIDCDDPGVTNRALLFSVPERRRVGEARGHTRQVTGVGFPRADDQTLVTASADCTARLWSLATFAERSCLELGSPALCLAARSEWAAVGTMAGALVIASAGGDPQVLGSGGAQLCLHRRLQLHQAEVTEVVITGRDSGLIVSCSADYTVAVTSRESGVVLARAATVNLPTCLSAWVPPPANPKAARPVQRPILIMVGDDSGHVYLFDLTPPTTGTAAQGQPPPAGARPPTIARQP